jgi:hypothetical protein
VYAFKIDSIVATKNEESKQVQWVTPVEQNTTHFVGEKDLNEKDLATAQELSGGDKCVLQWKHEYVTKDGSSGPRRPVNALRKE